MVRLLVRILYLNEWSCTTMVSGHQTNKWARLKGWCGWSHLELAEAFISFHQQAFVRIKNCHFVILETTAFWESLENELLE